MGSLDLLHTFQLMLHSPTVTAIGSTPPGHDVPVSKNGSKSATRTLYLLHVLYLILDSTALTAISTMTRGHDGCISKYGCKSAFSATYLNWADL